MVPERFLKALPKGYLAKHSAGLVCNQGMDPSFWVSFNTHNVNAEKNVEKEVEKFKPGAQAPSQAKMEQQ